MQPISSAACCFRLIWTCCRRAAASIGDVGEGSQDHDRDDHGAAKKGQIRYGSRLMSESEPYWLNQEFDAQASGRSKPSSEKRTAQSSSLVTSPPTAQAAGRSRRRRKQGLLLRLAFGRERCPQARQSRFLREQPQIQRMLRRTPTGQPKENHCRAETFPATSIHLQVDPFSSPDGQHIRCGAEASSTTRYHDCELLNF